MVELRNWIVGIGGGERKYRINNITYVVSSRFEPPKYQSTMKDRFRRSITSDFVPLTLPPAVDKMADEYVCSAAGKED